MGCHPGSVVPLPERRVDGARFSRALGFSGWSVSLGFNLESPAALARERVRLFLEALQPGTHFSSLPVRVLDGIFQQRAVASTLKTCCLVEPPPVSSAMSPGSRAASPCALMLWRWCPSLNLMTSLCWPQTYLLQLPPLPQPQS